MASGVASLFVVIALGGSVTFIIGCVMGRKERRARSEQRAADEMIQRERFSRQMHWAQRD